MCLVSCICHVMCTVEEDDDHRLMSEHDRLMSKVLSKDKISTFRPHLHGDPVVVTVYVSVDSFGSISAMSMEYTMNVDVYLEWEDIRLVHNTTDLVFQTVESIKQFWLPDIYFVNEKNGELHVVLSENIALVLQQSGTITYKTRLTLVLTCYMELHLFPLDIQHCPLLIRSYAYNDKHVTLKWRTYNPVMINPKIQLPQYDLPTGDPETSMNLEELPPLGNFSTLLVEFRLDRSLGFFIVNMFLPSVILVIISWISFWLHVDATPARASLGITSVLTLVTQSGTIRFTVPALSYPTAIDIWFSVCILFVFAALIEFALVNYFYIISVRASKREIVRGIPDDTATETEIDTPTDGKTKFSGEAEESNNTGELRLRMKGSKEYAMSMSTKSLHDKHKIKSRFYLKTAMKIDRYSRLVFPVVFILFTTAFTIYFYALQDRIK
ncbi:glycine receptor subunit alpha-2-like [Saccoglossus kowalevskii]|uniref:Glycine receptor subunit alpha-4-like n=1 Tax=Saccoglossus kowalevskii TaxID=10224 RepID=A0ABM0LYF8_SACKO|nr:PREDICTED: glycine receptor subunit alpha-4-like [Saccoglossus kowalevskii]